MKNIDYPPKPNGDKKEDLKNIPVESFEDIREIKNNLDDRAILEKKERAFQIPAHEQDRIKELNQELRAERIAEINSIPLRKPLGDESYTAYQGSIPSNSNRNWGRAGKFFAGIAALFGAHQAGATDTNAAANKIFSDSTSKKEFKMKTPADSTTKKNTVSLYTQSKTPEGGITPTGLSNSFYENEFGITESDIGKLASEYGFRTGSPLEFQSDLIDYMLEHHPDAIDGVMKKYGETNKGEGIQGLKDNMLGARTAFLMGLLKNGSAKLMIDGKEITYSTATPDTLEGGPKPSGGEMFSSDGYEKVIVAFDKSGSMWDNRALFAEKLKGNTSDVPIEVLEFTSSIESSTVFENAVSASEALRNIAITDQSDKQELVVDVLNTYLSSVEVQTGKTKMVICTDESLQKVTSTKLAQLQKLSVEKNVDLVFSIVINDKPYTLTLEDVQDSFNQLLDGFTKSVQLREKQIQEFQAEIDQTDTKKKRRDELKKQIEETREEISYFQNFIDGKNTVNLDNFDKDSGSHSVASK